MVLAGKPADALARHAADGHFDVLAVGWRGRGASKLVMGSVATQLSPRNAHTGLRGVSSSRGCWRVLTTANVGDVLEGLKSRSLSVHAGGPMIAADLDSIDPPHFWTKLAAVAT